MKKAGIGANNANKMLNQNLKTQKDVVRRYTGTKGATPILSETEVRSLDSFRELRIGF